jgi:CubicO group peptidase (beta-lactamase class C family)
MLLSLAFAAAAVAASPADPLFAEVARTDGPGCALDVRRDGAVLAQATYGAASLEPAQPIVADTVFEAGSVSKQFVGALVALLIERGTLAPQDSLRRWLPELPPAYAAVTLDMLMHHTSGIRDWGALADLSGWPRGSRAYTMDDAVRLIARQRSLNFAPGTEYLYSNSNYLLAVRVLERASGQTFSALSESELFSPLGMAATQWRDDFRRVVALRAQAYSRGEDGRWQLDMPFEDVIGPGGLLTTTGDLQRWNAALDRPSPRATGWVARMQAPGRLADGTPVPYGFGLELDPVDGRRAIAHAGATAGYRAWLGRFPDQRLSLALLCNAGSLNTEELGPRVAATFLPAPSSSSAPPRPPAVAAPAAVAGLYRNRASDAVVRVVRDERGLARIGGRQFGAVAPDRLAAADGRRVLLRRDAHGDMEELQVERPGNASARLVRVPPQTEDARALRHFAGRYRSTEIDGEQGIEARAGGGLVWIDPRGHPQPLAAAYADAFSAGESGWLLRFHRDRSGRVIGFDASIGRARRIGYARVDAVESGR